VPEKPPAPRAHGRLFRKYVGLFLAVVCIAFLTNGLSEIIFSFQEHKASLIRIQREQAEAAAAKIGQFVKRARTAPKMGPKNASGQWGGIRKNHVDRQLDQLDRQHQQTVVTAIGKAVLDCHVPTCNEADLF
jgi:hypothetical protein